MKFLGLRIREPKAEYQDAVVSLNQARRLPEITQRAIRNLRKSPESDESLPSSGASSQESTDSLTPAFPWTIEHLRDEVHNSEGSNSDLELKFKIMELAISDIDMGRYQYYLFVMCGIGWAADNLWIQGAALILPSLSSDFGLSTEFVRYATLSLNVGLSLGAAGWGVGSDTNGRRLGFNSTLFITGIFAFGLANARSFIAASSLLGALGFGVGGSLPVDGTMFVTRVLTTQLSQLLNTLVGMVAIRTGGSFAFAWLFLGTSFDAGRGWRLFMYTLGGLTLVKAIARLLFDSIESPKFLLGINKQAEAVRSIRALAHKNGTKTWLTEEILNEIGGTSEVAEEVESSTMEKVRQMITSFGPGTKRKISPLFGNVQLGLNTALLWLIWTCVGMGYPLFNAFLPQYLSNGRNTEGSSTTYRDYAIISVTAIPGSLLACLLVNKAGRRIPMAIATMITGIFFFLFTLRNESKFQLGFGCVASVFQNIMFGILYAYTPETFPGPSRGTGCGIAHSLSRLGGICAPLIAANVGSSNPSVPIYISAGLILTAFLAMCFLRIET